MQTAITLFGVLAALEDDGVLVELAFLDRDIDPNDILPHYTTSTNVQMSVDYTLGEKV